MDLGYFDINTGRHAHKWAQGQLLPARIGVFICSPWVHVISPVAPTRARGCSFPAQAIGAALITLRLLCRLAEHQHPPTPGVVPGKRVENKRKKHDFGKD